VARGSLQLPNHAQLHQQMLSYQNLEDQKHQLQEEPMLLVQQRTLHSFPGMRKAEMSPRKNDYKLERKFVTLAIKSTVPRIIYSTFTQYKKGNPAKHEPSIKQKLIHLSGKKCRL
jgi:hypothetical protein